MMDSVLNNIKSDSVKRCILDTRDAIIDDSTTVRAVSLTMSSLIRFGSINADKIAPVVDSKIKESIIKTGAYYFGPLFVLNKGTSIPNSEIFKELERRGFYTKSLSHLNSAQLNLFFITMKALGLVSDKHLISYVKYSA